MTQEEWNNAEDFLEGYMVDLTYDIVTQKIKLTDLIGTDEEVILLYDPFDIDGTDESWLLQDLMDHYEQEEEYERCAILLRMKKKVEIGLLDLSDILYLKDEDFVIDKLINESLGNNYNKN
jgi:hypothetical protein